MTITAQKLDDHEFQARVDRVVILSKAQIKVTASWTSADGDYAVVSLFDLSRDGRLLTEHGREPGGRRYVKNWNRCS